MAKAHKATTGKSLRAKVEPAAVPPDAICRSMELVDVTALAWVSAIRIRVKDLVNDLDKVTALRGYPGMEGAAAVLKTVIDPSALARLFAHMEEAEDLVDELLVGSALDAVPELARTCRHAAQEMGLADEE